MRVKNGFSILRLLTVLFWFATLISFIVAIADGKQNMLKFGVIFLLCLIIVKLLRYMYRD